MSPPSLAGWLLIGLLTPLMAYAQQDTCLLFAAENLAEGPGNFYLYQLFSQQRVRVERGDALEYEVFLLPGNPSPQGGVDAWPADGGPALRDVGADGRRLTDQNGLEAHGDALLLPALGRWYRRQIPLDALAGREIDRWLLVFEGDEPGRYLQWIDNVRVRRANAEAVVIYEDGDPSANQVGVKQGYESSPILIAVPRADVQPGRDFEALVERALRQAERRRQVEELRHGARLLETVAQGAGDTSLRAHVEAARQQLEGLERQPDLDADAFQAGLRAVREELANAHPLMQQFTGHLVGHAHIDFQWLWEWPETVEVCRQTFSQALDFMDRFPEFTFSQSSSGLYAAIEPTYPQLFARIRDAVAEGRWEIIGGRICEGDEHMISPESHARHFLYGQRYFRERFGKQATVGWEPDTFGHTAQMPQILRLGGCESYYFCRGGKGIPLFWWEALDGSRVLAFEDPANGSWYNSDLTDRQWQGLASFFQRTGSRDMLWVYGVGNHGGGPTLEQIQTAQQWQGFEFLPRPRFSTAAAFFQRLRQYDLTRLPVVRGELNTSANGGFFGVYTSHADIKRWNRDAEALTESAEATAALASLFGFPYPAAELRRNWEDIGWNHHHDTLSGTCIHASYDLSRRMYERVQESSRRIGQQAVEFLAGKTKGRPGDFFVFNPMGWSRDGVVELDLRDLDDLTDLVAEGADGSMTPVQLVAGGRLIFLARNVPAFGYRVYHLRRGRPKAVVRAALDGRVLENDRLRVEIDPQRGQVIGVLDRKTGWQAVAPGGSAGRLEVHWEEPNGMSAWTVGAIRRVEALSGTPDSVAVVENGPVRATVRIVRRFQDSRIEQDVSLVAGQPQLDFVLRVEWNEIGSSNRVNPFLKAAFDLNLREPAAAYEVPFGAIERPSDNQEVPALKWADLTEYRRRPLSRPGAAPAPLDLAPHLNADIFSPEDCPADGSFDGEGRSFPDTTLPGGEWRWQDLPFRLPAVRLGKPNAIACAGQHLEVPPGRYTALAVLGAAGMGDAEGSVELLYAGGGLQFQSLALTDWCAEPRHGETVALRSDHRHERTGEAAPPCALFLQRVPVDPKRELIAIRLPVQPRMKLVALTVGDFGPAPTRRGAGLRGASLFNDCKHGHSAEGNTLRLSLLRCSFSPDPAPEVGSHVMRFAFYPHAGDWRAAGTVRRASAYNHPLMAARTPGSGRLSATGSFLQVGPESVVVTGLKRAEEDDDLVLRLYEAHGNPVEVRLATAFPLQKAAWLNFLEEEIGRAESGGRKAGNGLRFRLGKHEIRNLALRAGRKAALSARIR